MKAGFLRVCSLISIAALILCLISCSNENKEQIAPTSSSITPASVAYADKQLVFAATELSKDASARVYIFENGNITFRSNSLMKLRDLVGLSDEQIEAMFRDADNASRNESHNYNDPYYEYIEYPVVDTVNLYTDESGNNVERESIIVCDYIAQQISDGEIITVMDGDAWNHTAEFELWDTVEAEPILDSYFGGFKGAGISFDRGTKYYLIQVDDPESVTFSWDEIGAAGTTRD